MGWRETLDVYLPIRDSDNCIEEANGADIVDSKEEESSKLLESLAGACRG